MGPHKVRVSQNMGSSGPDYFEILMTPVALTAIAVLVFLFMDPPAWLVAAFLAIVLIVWAVAYAWLSVQKRASLEAEERERPRPR